MRENRDTYVFIDVSNIRAACLKTLKFKIDFRNFIQYLKRKYPNLKEVRYYEGIASNDKKKEAEFSKLAKIGYTICGLSRKAYLKPGKYKNVKCKNCGFEQKVLVSKSVVKLKSNIDVFLANDFLEVAHFANQPVLLILVSCDGDYAEMIKGAINKNELITALVLATPFVRNILNNAMSVRLTRLVGELPRFNITDIASIQKYIEQK